MVTKVQLAESRVPRLGDNVILLLNEVPWPATVVGLYRDGPIVTVDTMDPFGELWYSTIVVPTDWKP